MEAHQEKSIAAKIRSIEKESSKSVKARAIVKKVSKKVTICVRPCRDPDRREKGRVQTSIIVFYGIDES